MEDLENQLRILSLRARAAEQENFYLREKLALYEGFHFNENSQILPLSETPFSVFTSFWVMEIIKKTNLVSH